MAASVGLSWRSCVCVHIAIFTWYAFTLWFNCSFAISSRHPGAQSYGGRWKYLTFINLVMQTVFFGVCVLTDIIHILFSSKSMHGGLPLFLTKARDIFFAVLSFPIGIFVCASFWSIYAYDRELVFPKYLDDIIPLWLNHALHTVIIPLLLVETYLQPHKYPSRTKGILGLAVFSAVYLAWILWVHHVSGIWVYPILAHLSPGGLVLFLGVASLTMAPLYLLGEKLSCMIWGTTGTSKKKR